MTAPVVTDEEFRKVVELVRRRTGIQIDDSKRYLVETRLGPLLAELNCRSYSDLCHRAVAEREVLNRIIDEISTNETSFFRDTSPFELLKFKLIPDLMDRRQGTRDTISIWSAASSTGQEVYSIAMACAEVLPPADLARVTILGTDISELAVRTASRAEYSAYEVERGMPPSQRERFMIPDGRRWRVDDQLRALATFRQVNLLEPFTTLGRFDIIFCRNVAIYFDTATRRDLFDRMARQLKPAGALVIGASETLQGITDSFSRHNYMRSFFYTARQG